MSNSDIQTTRMEITFHENTQADTTHINANEQNNTTNQCQDYNEINYKLLQLHYNILTATFNSGHTLDRWCNSTTLMIEKIPGCPRIDKLRVIHLYEADYNLGLRIHWSRRAVWNAHLQGRLDESQAGSRPGKRCIDVVLQKELKFLYARLTRTSIATADNVILPQLLVDIMAFHIIYVELTQQHSNA